MWCRWRRSSRRAEVKLCLWVCREQQRRHMRFHATQQPAVMICLLLINSRWTERGRGRGGRWRWCSWTSDEPNQSFFPEAKCSWPFKSNHSIKLNQRTKMESLRDETRGSEQHRQPAHRYVLSNKIVSHQRNPR